jgi:hypothetical protein
MPRVSPHFGGCSPTALVRTEGSAVAPSNSSAAAADPWMPAPTCACDFIIRSCQLYARRVAASDAMRVILRLRRWRAARSWSARHRASRACAEPLRCCSRTCKSRSSKRQNVVRSGRQRKVKRPISRSFPVEAELPSLEDPDPQLVVLDAPKHFYTVSLWRSFRCGARSATDKCAKTVKHP